MSDESRAVALVCDGTMQPVVWQGPLEPAEVARGGTTDERPEAIIGWPYFWNAEDVMFAWKDTDTTPTTFRRPKGDYYFWLLQLPCTLRLPPTVKRDAWRITEAQLSLSLKPFNKDADALSTTAFMLLPERQEVTESRALRLRLDGPSYNSPDRIDFTAFGIGTEWAFQTTFTTVESYGAGTATPSWLFRAAKDRSLQGLLQVYAVVAVAREAEGLRARVELKVTAEQKATGMSSIFGLVRDRTASDADDFRFKIAPRGS